MKSFHCQEPYDKHQGLLDMISKKKLLMWFAHHDPQIENSSWAGIRANITGSFINFFGLNEMQIFHIFFFIPMSDPQTTLYGHKTTHFFHVYHFQPHQRPSCTQFTFKLHTHWKHHEEQCCLKKLYLWWHFLILTNSYQIVKWLVTI